MNASSAPPPALSVRGVSHRYGRGATAALNDVTFTVPQGSFTALLGPNGAGKTTLFGLATGLLGLQTGSVLIEGRDLRAGPRSLAHLGLVFQQPTLDLDMTVRENLLYFAALHDIPRPEARRRIEEELDRLGMTERAGERVRSLNGGHRRRAEIARALLHRPRLLMLDEPTVGLDLAARRAITDHVHVLTRARAIGVLWTTHLIDEVEPQDDLVVLDRGRVAAAGRMGEVTRAAGADTLEAAFDDIVRRGRAA